MNTPVIPIPVLRLGRTAVVDIASAPVAPPALTDSAVHRPAPVFHIQHLELAPEGWRLCVEKIAEGFAEIIGEHAYCLNCGGVLDRKHGHDVTCLTMVARRILANEPLLHAQRSAALQTQETEGQFPGVDIDAAHTRP